MEFHLVDGVVTLEAYPPGCEERSSRDLPVGMSV